MYVVIRCVSYVWVDFYCFGVSGKIFIRGDFFIKFFDFCFIYFVIFRDFYFKKLGEFVRVFGKIDFCIEYYYCLVSVLVF